MTHDEIWRLAEKMQGIWHTRWAGDGECWANMSEAYRKVWFDIALASRHPLSLHFVGEVPRADEPYYEWRRDPMPGAAESKVVLGGLSDGTP